MLEPRSRTSSSSGGGKAEERDEGAQSPFYANVEQDNAAAFRMLRSLLSSSLTTHEISTVQ